MSHDSDIAKLRSEGLTPKAIARQLGLRPAEVTAAIQRIAASAPKNELGTFEGAWIGSHWTEGLGFADEVAGWQKLDPADHEHPGAGGLTEVLVARHHRYDEVVIAGYLVDLWCLGVKDTYGPRTMKRDELGSFASRFFQNHEVFGEIPEELAQAVVLGAANYAGSLGFEPHADFEKVKPLLGADTAPAGITFGFEGKPKFLQGPKDDVARVLQTLTAAVGEDGFAVEELPLDDHDHDHHDHSRCGHDHHH